MKNCSVLLAAVVFGCIASDRGKSVAQSILPATDDAGTIVMPEGNRFDITGGQRSHDGTNLFHSFDRFGLDAGQIANFLSNPQIQNILGRVTGGNASIINGLIQVTGGNSNLFLMNPAGIVFGPNASLNVPADFTATTATGIGFGDHWFNAIGENNWNALVGNPSQFAFGLTEFGAIANLGNLTLSPGHHLTLLGGSIINSGTLSSPGGNITIAAVPGESVVRISQENYVLSLDIAKGQLLMVDSNEHLAIGPEQVAKTLPEYLTGGNLGHATQVVTNSEGNIQLISSSDRVLNSGQISATEGSINLRGYLVENRGEIIADGANGGQIEVETQNLLDTGRISAIGTTGRGGEITVNYSDTVIQTATASTFVNGQSTGGKITFNGGENTVLTTSAILEATGEIGGSVRVFGQDLRLLATQIHVAGNRGEGEILIGGDFQGRTQESLNAQHTFINPATHLNADALTAGDGGRVIVWSDQKTQFYGNISATGGEEIGNGGLIEVSSKNELIFAGFADASAANGTPGKLLLDPKNITIDENASGPFFEIFDPNPAGDNRFGTNNAVLTNGNIVVSSPFDDLGANDAGAIYLFDPQTGALVGQINGTSALEQLGNQPITTLSNGNFVFGNPNADIGGIPNTGTVILVNGDTGAEINRISGNFNNDFFGDGEIVELINGNFVFGNRNADIGGIANAGTVILGDGNTGTEINRISGVNNNDRFGNGKIAALNNGNYVFGNSNADVDITVAIIADAGIVILAEGTNGTEIGRISGARLSDNFGSGEIIALDNGNFVFANPNTDVPITANQAIANAGSVILANGTNAEEINRISGQFDDDQYGSGKVVALSNGNYVFTNPQADLNNQTVDAGTVIVADGTTGQEIDRIDGAIASDQFGSNEVLALSNGNFVFGNQNADINGTFDSGTVILADGTTGQEISRISGAIRNDLFGTGQIVELTNGNYVFGNRRANINGIPEAGTTIVADGNTGQEIGRISGTMNNHEFGSDDIIALSNGNFVFGNNDAAIDGVDNSGLIIYADGTTVEEIFRISGPNESDFFGNGGIFELNNGNFIFGNPTANNNAGRVLIGITDVSTLTYGYFPGEDVAIAPNLITRVTDTGTTVTLQANNDIIVNSPILTNNNGNGGDLVLRAGRSILVNDNITTDNGDFTAIANDITANGVVDAQRDAGNAEITLAAGVEIDSGTGNTTLTISTGEGLTNNDSGELAIAGTLNTANLTLENKGPSNGGITIADTATLNYTGDFLAITTGGAIAINAPFNLGGPARIETDGGEIALNAAIDGNASLTFNAGAGNVILGAIGETIPLASVSVNSTGTTTLNNNITANGDINFTGATGGTELGADVAIATNNGNVLFQNSAIAGAGRTLAIDAVTGNVSLDTVGSQGNELSGFAIAEATQLNLFGDIFTNGGLNFTTTNTVAIAADSVSLETDSDNSAIDFTDVLLRGPGALILKAGSGQVSLGKIDPILPLASLNVNTTGLLELSGDIKTADPAGFTLEEYSTVNLITPVTIDTSSGNGPIALISPINGNFPLTLSAGSGNVTLGNLGQITPLDSLTVSTSSQVNLTGNITTQGTNGVTLNSPTTELLSDVTINTSLGNAAIQLNGSIEGRDRQLSLNAGMGSVQLGKTANNTTFLNGLAIAGGEIESNSLLEIGDRGLNIQASGDVNLNAETTTTNGGSVAIANSGQLNLNSEMNLDGSFAQSGTGTIFISDNITTNNQNISFSGPVVYENIPEAQINAGTGAIAFESTLAAGTTNLTLSGNEIDWKNAISGTGVLRLQPGTAEQNIEIAGEENTPALDLTATEISLLQDGFSAIEIGRNDGSGIAKIYPVSFSDPIAILSTEGRLDLTGVLSGTDNASVTLRGSAIALARDIETEGTDITLDGNVVLSADVTLTTGEALRGNITFQGTLDGARGLTLSAGAGNVRWLDDIGSTTPLQSLSVNALQTFLSSTLNATGNVIFNNPVILTGNAGIFTKEGNITFESTIDSASTPFDLSLSSESGKITFQEAVGASTSLGQLEILSATNVNAAGAIAARDVNFSATNIQLGEVTTTGGSVRLRAMNDLRTRHINTANVNGNGHDIFVESVTGAFVGGDLISRGTRGGNVTVMARDRIETGNIDSSGTVGNAGNVFLDPDNNIEVGYINATGGNNGTGGNVKIITQRFFRASNTFRDRNGQEASISTAGGLGGGSIALSHAGGDLETPLIIGNATTNGTAGVITTGPETLAIGESFLDPVTRGNITVSTTEPPPPEPEELETPQFPPSEPQESETPPTPPSQPEELETPQFPPSEPQEGETPPTPPSQPEELETPQFQPSAPQILTIAPPEAQNFDSQPPRSPETETTPEPDSDRIDDRPTGKTELPAATESPEAQTESSEASTESVAETLVQPNIDRPTVEIEPSIAIAEPSANVSILPESVERSIVNIESLVEPSFEPSVTPETTQLAPMTSQQQSAIASSVRSTDEETALGSSDDPGVHTESAAAILDPLISSMEESFSSAIAEYHGLPTASEPVSLPQAQGIVRRIESETGVRPALVYVRFAPTTLESNRENDQLEIVLVTAEGEPISQRIPNSNRATVEETVNQFRAEMTGVGIRRNEKYLKTAQQLYEWLIAPMEADLEARGIQNIAFVMDVGLRTLPIAALHDGKQFLIEKYSVGMMPSVSLTDTRYTNIQNMPVLAMGASEFSELDPLPAVPVEVQTITQHIREGEYFLNDSFTLDNIKSQRKIKNYGIIHLATHGQFKPGQIGNSYIQLWDKKLRLNEVRQLGFNDPPVELLVLSACRTAVGDEQAELGFAGFAVQAGVKTAVASLWYVSDEGTFGLMSEFYQQLNQAPIKAEALRQAQIAMINGTVQIQEGVLQTSAGEFPLPPSLAHVKNKELSHPYFWSAFAMIGSPW